MHKILIMVAMSLGMLHASGGDAAVASDSVNAAAGGGDGANSGAGVTHDDRMVRAQSFDSIGIDYVDLAEKLDELGFARWFERLSAIVQDPILQAVGRGMRAKQNDLMDYVLSGLSEYTVDDVIQNIPRILLEVREKDNLKLLSIKCSDISYIIENIFGILSERNNYKILCIEYDRQAFSLLLAQLKEGRFVPERIRITYPGPLSRRVVPEVVNFHEALRALSIRRASSGEVVAAPKLEIVDYQESSVSSASQAIHDALKRKKIRVGSYKWDPDEGRDILSFEN